LGKVLPKYCADVEIVPRLGKEGLFRYLAIAPASDEVYEFGEKEYFIFKQLNGETPLETIRKRFYNRFNIPLNPDYLESFVIHLTCSGLLEPDASIEEHAVHDDDEVAGIKIFDPDRLLAFLLQLCWWCFTPYFLIFTGITVFLALGVLFKYGGDLVFEIEFLWEPVFFFFFPLLGIFVIQIACEIAKGVACKYYGGHVHEFGVWFLFKIVPFFYCDLTDTLWMEDQSNRKKILSAGIVFHLLLLSMSILGWYDSHTGSKVNLFFIIFICVATLYLFYSVNPFFQRDGYTLLSVWLKTPDLRSRAINFCKHWLLGKQLPEPLTQKQVRTFKIYGLSLYGFHFVFWSALLGLIGYLLVYFLNGTGAILFLIILFFRFNNHLNMFNNYLKRILMKLFDYKTSLLNESGMVNLPVRRFVKFGVPIIIILVMLIPYPFSVGGDFRIVPQNQLGIRAKVAGEIKEVFVKEGDFVKEGQPVAVMVGREQQKTVDEVQASLDNVHARLELLRQGAKTEEIKRAEQEVATAEKSLEYSSLQADRCEGMFKNKAISKQEYENALKQRDLDKEKLELAKRNLELVKSGARDEEIKALEADERRLQVLLANAKEDLKQTTMLSPVDGRIITPNVSQSVGQYLLVGDLLAVVEQRGDIIAEIELPEEDVGEVKVGAETRLRAWAFPRKIYSGKVTAIAPVAFEKSKGRIDRALSEREWRIEQKELIRKKGKVVRVLSSMEDPDGVLKTGMTGYGKISCGWRPVGIAFTRWLGRFIFVEVWSWLP